jgi:Bacterial Ig domain
MLKRKSMAPFLGCLAVALGLVTTTGSSPASAATFTVTDCGNSGPGTLRAAITLAEATPTPDVIDIQLCSSIQLSADPISAGTNTADVAWYPGRYAFAVTTNITIRNVATPGKPTRLSPAALTDCPTAGVGPGLRAFYVSPTATLSLNDLEISGFCAFGQNGSGGSAGAGGAVYNEGFLFVDRVLFAENRVRGGYGSQLVSLGGGGMRGPGVVISSSNRTGGCGYNAFGYSGQESSCQAFANEYYNSLTLGGRAGMDLFGPNSGGFLAGGGAGWVCPQPQCDPPPGGSGGFGGGGGRPGYKSSSVPIVWGAGGSPGYGGGTPVAGLSNGTGGSGGGGAGLGGAIFSNGGLVFVQNSSFWGNTATAGIGGIGAKGMGGAIFTRNTAPVLSHASFAANSGSGDGASTIDVVLDAPVSSFSMDIANSAFASTPSTSSVNVNALDPSSSINVRIFSSVNEGIFSRTGPGTGTTTGLFNPTSPGFEAFSFGPVGPKIQGLVPGSASPLLGVANPTYCTPIDMRGNGRPVGGVGCDIGAIQRNPVDALSPGIAITSPLPNQTLNATPVNIIGFATDNVGVASVAVAIYRNVGGGQYWNGTGWQSGNTVVPANLTSPGATNTNWSYNFSAPPGGVFAVAAIAYDGAGNYTVAPYQNFSITDNVVPTVTLTTPTPSQAFTTRPVTITGTATDNAGVGDVQIAIYRPMDPVGQFWNGTGWQVEYTTVPATLAAPGSATTTYTYSFNPPQAGGYFYVAAIALDTSYKYNLTPFTLFTLPDSIAPTALVANPVAGPTTGALTITGTATDNISINRIGIAIYRLSTGLYWNGTTWQSAFASIPAALGNPGATTSSYTLTYTPPAPGTYYIGAVPVDGNYNYTLTPFTIVNHT